ncbi:Prefoldin subunit-domain-containing protein [Daldinia caldariorum]|uniref:Prefoldin subunit-domain-containing protein n=1 Tax=Daldinia caldariorum TaxID=326644 RepID=UPI0020078913|nr:Prefoldin subunit-domain-containing protein [Daldinia caldariorum]KAI1464295.1 Prefoldin subunit-domain-containing protein [Daldinia caldariorum]
MAAAKDSFLDLERHRQKLKENVTRLSNALDHWKQWKQEYETLRADVKSLPSVASRKELRSTREKFKGELLNEKELVDIFGRDDSKKPEQIISTLTKRLDYVSKNIDTLGKQREDAENRLAAVTIVANPDATDEEGLPITEIFEELDDDDNVVSYSLRTAGDTQPQVLEALWKAGITDFSTDSTASPGTSNEAQDGKPAASNGDSSTSSQQYQEPQVDTPSNRIADDSKELQAEEKAQAKSASRKKSVTFSEDTKSGEDPEKSETAKRLEEILQKAKDQQSIISDPVFPADESMEDAALREDMIRYNKETMEFEMAPIVAELQLEEGSTGDDTDDYSDYEEEDDEDEDEWGKTKLTVDDDWKLRMLELKERLSNYSFDKSQAENDEDEMVEGIGRISIKREGQDALVDNVESEPAVPPQADKQLLAQDKKSVRFAQSLDIAEAPAPAPAPKQASQTKAKQQREIDPLSDVIMERSGKAPPPVAAPSKKVSRFRKERNNGIPINATPVALGGTLILPDVPDVPAPTPSGPENQTLATSVLEHEPSSVVKEPDEFDANLLQKQATQEYYKMRNKLIYQQGGFMKEDESPIQPLDEEQGGPKRLSRFKAARLAKS